MLQLHEFAAFDFVRSWNGLIHQLFPSKFIAIKQLILELLTKTFAHLGVGTPCIYVVVYQQRIDAHII